MIAPAGSVQSRELLLGLERIRAQGFEIELSANLFETNGYLAGDPRLRAQDLVDLFSRDDINAIFCARGGFGSIQLLPYLTADFVPIPKIFVGYSDITILLNWLHQYHGIITFHGPMVAMDFARGLSEEAGSHFWPLLTGDIGGWKIGLGEVIRGGAAEGELIGGCLSLLVTTLATPYEIETEGKLLFVEDIGEKPYRVERMLTQLQMAGKFNRLAGVLFGDFTNCGDGGGRGIKDIIVDLFRHAPYPVVMGMRAGHGEDNLALPFGARMELDGNTATLELLESPVA